MSNRRRIRRKKRERDASRERRAAIYVDELQPIEERRKELVNILRSNQTRQKRWKKLIIYGSGASDADDSVRDAIALITEHGTVVRFAHD